MKLKLTAEGHAVVQDGKPVFIYDDGKEVAFDAVAAVGKLEKLGGDLDGYRTKFHEAEGKLKGYEGLDLEQAKKDRETVKNLADGKLVQAGEIDKLKGEISEAWQRKYGELETKAKADLDAKDAEIFGLTVGSDFANSKFLAEKTILPAQIAIKEFGQSFKVEGGKVVGYVNGARILSRANPGEPAPFDEAIEEIVKQYPLKDRILKSPGAGGSAATTATTTAVVTGGVSVIDRERAKDPAQYRAAKAAAEKAGGSLQIAAP